jgi:protein-disulfide isomerase
MMANPTIVSRRRLVTLSGGAALGTAGLAAALLVAGRGTPSQAASILEHAQGAPDAPVTMIEYASLTCPHCAHFHTETLPTLRSTYVEPGRMRLVYRDFPLDQLALQAAQIAHAAGPDRYFAMLGVMFAQQAVWSRAEDPIAALKQLVQLGGMSGAEVDAALADEALRDAILATRLDGEQTHAIRSTPSFLINGTLVTGDQGVAKFSEIIDQLLS